MKSSIIAATFTPLNEDEALCETGLAQHLEHIWDSGIDGVLIAGSMGLMQMLRDDTWARLVTYGSELSIGRGEVLLGVGDVGTARVVDRIEVTNTLKADGVVVLTPYVWRFDDNALVAHYRRIAEASRHPVYLYDLPAITGRPITLELMQRLADIKNIAGVKCSGAPDLAVEVTRVFSDRFRVVMAQPLATGIFLRSGYRYQLDGIYALAPNWSASIAKCADQGDWDQAAVFQAKLANLLAIVRGSVFPICDVIWRARGFEGGVLPSPIQSLPESEQQKLLTRPIIEECVSTG